MDFSKRSALTYAAISENRVLYDYLLLEHDTDDIKDEFGNTPSAYISGNAVYHGI